MKLLADEGVDKPIVDHLRTLGYGIRYIFEESPGVDDLKVLRLALENKALLITMDTDFGELVYRLKEATHGVLLIRLAGLDADQKKKIVATTLKKHLDEMKGHFSVLSKDSLRIRTI